MIDTSNIEAGYRAFDGHIFTATEAADSLAGIKRLIRETVNGVAS